MYAAVIDENYERIRGDLVRRGLTYDRLLDDLLDHVCCMLEKEMQSGNDFNTSYQHVMGSIPEKQLPLIQHQTLLNLDKKFQRMKKITYQFGLVSAILVIVGSIFKKLHWPGSGVLLTVGILLVVLGFLPLYFRSSYREQPEKKNPVYGVVGYITLALLLAGALFKIMHWPGANVMIYVSTGFLIIGFVPLYVVNVFQRSGKENVILPYIVMVLIGISIIMLFATIRMSRYNLDTYRNEAVANEQRVVLIRERTASLLELARDSAYTDQLEAITKVHDRARDLLVMFQAMQDDIKAYVDEAGVATAELEHLDNTRIGRAVIVDNGTGWNIMLESRKFKELLDEVVKDPVARSQIDDHLEFAGEVWQLEFGGSAVTNAPLIKNYYKNGDAAKGIALSEYVAIASLLHQ